VVTRPEPTIYGNCDSWSFIVGKKPRAYRRLARRTASLQTSNSKFIHRLLTIFMDMLWDNLWAICGPAVQRFKASHMADYRAFDMPRSKGRAPILSKKAIWAAES
jgi:hypothetical protein